MPESFSNYIVITVVAFCFIIGFYIKNYTKIPNKFIPLIMLGCGVIFNVILAVIHNDTLSLTTFLSGAISGLSSCGTYDFLSKSLNFSKNEDSNDSPEIEFEEFEPEDSDDSE